MVHEVTRRAAHDGSRGGLEVTRGAAHEGISGALTVEGKSLTARVLDEILAALLMHRGHVPARNRRSTRRRQRSHLTGTGLEMIMDGHGLLVGIRMRRVVREMTRRSSMLGHSGGRSADRGHARVNGDGADGNGLELVLAVIEDGFIDNAIVQFESGAADEASTVNENVLGAALLADVAEAAFLVPMLDDTNFRHDVD